MIFHMLGGGPAQLSAITCAKEKGFKVLVSDINRNAPGFDLADYQSFASTFDGEAVLEDAKKYRTSFLMTTGTDQPVLTAARVSEQLNLPYFLTTDQALKVTNKKVMKRAFTEASVPTMNYVILEEDFSHSELASLSFPLVIKPLDSQGQRGVLKVHSVDEIRKNFSRLLGFSRQKEILAEEYYPSVELTVSGWVEEGNPVIFLITDRVTVDNGAHLGVCISHRYPSLYHHKKEELEELVRKITFMIGLKKGPIYFQILAGAQGFRVNEIACRLGGAYEDEFIPFMTGVPMLDLMVDMTAEIPYRPPLQFDIDRIKTGKFLSLQMFFYDEGRILSQEGMDNVLAIEGILGGRFLLKEGTVITSRENSTQRAGYFIVTGHSAEEINRRITSAYDKLNVRGSSGKPLLQFDKRMLYPQ